MPRPLSAWNKFVKTVFHNERKQNPKCTFSDALKKASKLKKAGKMKGGLGVTENDISNTSSGMDMIESSGTGLSGTGSGMTGMNTSSSMTGGKTRKVKSRKSRKTRKSVKSRKSRKSKK